MMPAPTRPQLPAAGSIAWPTRQVHVSEVAAARGLEAFLHLTPPDHPMARFVIGFAACPRWRKASHRAGDELMLTLWITPGHARCTVCTYAETLEQLLERLGMELAE